MEHNRRYFLGHTIGTAVSAVIAVVGAGNAFAKSAGVQSLTHSATTAAPEESITARSRSSQVINSGDGQSGRRLRMVNVHTKEKISVVYRKGDVYVGQALKQINYIMRDYRVNKVRQIDPATIDYLYELYNLMETDEYIQILSGYRSFETNEMLRKRSKAVARKSLHIAGKAVDFRIPGSATKDLQLSALDLKLGGIGYYKKSDFVHIDSGRFRHW